MAPPPPRAQPGDQLRRPPRGPRAARRSRTGRGAPASAIQSESAERPADRRRIPCRGVAVQDILQGLRQVAAGGEPHQIRVRSPTSGVLSAVARVKSSAGSSPARPAATRSATAIWAETSSRSWPRPHRRDSSGRGSPPRRPARACAPGSARRPGARPGRWRRPGSSRSAPPAPPAGRDDRRALVSGASTGAVQASGSVSARARRSATAPPPRGRRPGTGMDRPPRGILEGQALVMRVEGEDRVDRLEDQAGRAERQGQRHVLEGEAGRARFLDPGRPGEGEFPRLGALEAVDRLLRVAHGEAGPGPGPGALAGGDSWVIARRISHCSGLVSCASSTSTWSMPRSSLYSTQPPPAPDPASRSSALWIRSSKSSAPSRAFWPRPGGGSRPRAGTAPASGHGPGGAQANE